VDGELDTAIFVSLIALLQHARSERERADVYSIPSETDLKIVHIFSEEATQYRRLLSTKGSLIFVSKRTNKRHHHGRRARG
jgi:hypothetical protein